MVDIIPDVKTTQRVGLAEALDVGLLIYRPNGWEKKVYDFGTSDIVDIEETGIARPLYWPIPLPRADKLYLRGQPTPSGDLNPSGWWQAYEYDWLDGEGPLVQYVTASGEEQWRGWPDHLVPFQHRLTLEGVNQLPQIPLPKYDWEDVETDDCYSYFGRVHSSLNPMIVMLDDTDNAFEMVDPFLPFEGTATQLGIMREGTLAKLYFEDVSSVGSDIPGDLLYDQDLIVREADSPWFFTEEDYTGLPTSPLGSIFDSFNRDDYTADPTTPDTDGMGDDPTTTHMYPSASGYMEIKDKTLYLASTVFGAEYGSYLMYGDAAGTQMSYTDQTSGASHFRTIYMQCRVSVDQIANGVHYLNCMLFSESVLWRTAGQKYVRLQIPLVGGTVYCYSGIGTGAGSTESTWTTTGSISSTRFDSEKWVNIRIAAYIWATDATPDNSSIAVNAWAWNDDGTAVSGYQTKSIYNGVGHYYDLSNRNPSVDDAKYHGVGLISTPGASTQWIKLENFKIGDWRFCSAHHPRMFYHEISGGADSLSDYVEKGDIVRVSSIASATGWQMFSIVDLVGATGFSTMLVDDDYESGLANDLSVQRRVDLDVNPWTGEQDPDYPGMYADVNPYVSAGDGVWAWAINAIRQCFELLEIHAHQIEGAYEDVQGYTTTTRYWITRKCKKVLTWEGWHKSCEEKKRSETGAHGGEVEERQIDPVEDPGDPVKEPSIRVVDDTYMGSAYPTFDLDTATPQEIEDLHDGKQAVLSADDPAYDLTWIRRLNPSDAGNGINDFYVDTGETFLEAVERHNGVSAWHRKVTYDPTSVPLHMKARLGQTTFNSTTLDSWGGGGTYGTTWSSITWTDYEFTGGADPDPNVYNWYVGDQECGAPQFANGMPSGRWTGSAQVKMRNGFISKAVQRLVAGTDSVHMSHINELRDALEAFEVHTHLVTLWLLITGVSGEEPVLRKIQVQTETPEFELGYGQPSTAYRGQRVDESSPVYASDINELAVGCMWLYDHRHRINFTYEDVIKHEPGTV